MGFLDWKFICRFSQSITSHYSLPYHYPRDVKKFSQSPPKFPSDAQNLSERILLTISTITLHIDIIVFIYSLSINKWVKNLQSILLFTFFAFLMSISFFFLPFNFSGIVTSKFAVFILGLFGIHQEMLTLLFCSFSELIIGSLIILYSLPPFFQIVMGMHIISGIVNRIFDKFQGPENTSWAESHQIIILIMTLLSIFMILLCIVLKNYADFKKSQIKSEEIPQPIEPTSTFSSLISHINSLLQ